MSSHFQVESWLNFYQVKSSYFTDNKSISSRFRVKSSQLSWHKRLPGLDVMHWFYILELHFFGLTDLEHSGIYTKCYRMCGFLRYRCNASLTSCMTSWLDVLALTLVVRFFKLPHEIDDNWCLEEYLKFGCYISFQKELACYEFLTHLGPVGFLWHWASGVAQHQSSNEARKLYRWIMINWSSAWEMFIMDGNAVSCTSVEPVLGYIGQVLLLLDLSPWWSPTVRAHTHNCIWSDSDQMQLCMWVRMYVGTHVHASGYVVRGVFRIS